MTFSTLLSLNPPPAPLSTNSKPQSTPGESSQLPPHGATTLMVHRSPCSRSFGLVLLWKIQSWCWIPPPVPGPRRGISSLMPKGAPPSKYFFSPHFPSLFQRTVFSASGSITLNNVQYKWKTKGTGTKLVVCIRSQPPSESFTESLILACKQ